MRFKMDVLDDGSVRWHGVDTGETKVVADNRERKILALHIAGHSAQAGYKRIYGPAHYGIYEYEIVAVYKDGICIEIDELFGVLHWDVRSKK